MIVSNDDRFAYVTIKFHFGADSVGAGDYVYLYGITRDMIRLGRSSFRLERDQAGDGLFEEIVYSGQVNEFPADKLTLQIPIEFLPDIAQKRIWLYSMTSQDCIPDECTKVAAPSIATAKQVPSLTPPPHPKQTPTPTASAPWEACPGVIASRLHSGDRAYVSYAPELPSRVRSAPNADSRVLGQLAAGESMIILDGPLCADGQIWWNIESDPNGLTGWTAENYGETYWLIPGVPE